MNHRSVDFREDEVEVGPAGTELESPFVLGEPVRPERFGSVRVELYGPTAGVRLRFLDGDAVPAPRGV